jgi:hypothetical protein
MLRSVFVLSVLFSLTFPAHVAAQSGLGGLRGYVRDSQGGALPGVTVTATAPEAIRPTVVVTNEEGYYRLINLPPGAGNYTQYNYSGANERFNPNYLQMRNQQPARAFQATVVYRF